MNLVGIERVKLKERDEKKEDTFLFVYVGFVFAGPRE